MNKSREQSLNKMTRKLVNVAICKQKKNDLSMNFFLSPLKLIFGVELKIANHVRFPPFFMTDFNL